jgi:hypothetical protein
MRMEGARQIGALVGLGAEVVALSLDEGGRQTLGPQGVVRGQRRREGRYGDATTRSAETMVSRQGTRGPWASGHAGSLGGPPHQRGKSVARYMVTGYGPGGPPDAPALRVTAS